MANEWNITKEELMEDVADVFAGEDKGVTDENKIVPIVNKGNSAGSETVTAAGPAAQAAASIIAAQAEQISMQPAGSDVQTPVQAASLAESPAPNASAAAPVAAPADQTTVQTQQAASQTIVQTQQAASQTPVQTASPTTQSASYDNFTVPSGSSADDGFVGPDTQTGSNAPGTGTKAEPERRRRRKTSSYTGDFDDDLDPDEEDRPRKRFFRFRSGNEEESRDKMILSRIKDEDLMEYLALEQRRLEFLQQAKEAKEKRILIAFQLLISLAAIVAITYLLQDNPTILISILYIVGIVAALNVWRNPHDKGRKR